jgi:hypothetical protein
MVVERRGRPPGSARGAGKPRGGGRGRPPKRDRVEMMRTQILRKLLRKEAIGKGGHRYFIVRTQSF